MCTLLRTIFLCLLVTVSNLAYTMNDGEPALQAEIDRKEVDAKKVACNFPTIIKTVFYSKKEKNRHTCVDFMHDCSFAVVGRYSNEISLINTRNIHSFSLSLNKLGNVVTGLTCSPKDHLFCVASTTKQDPVVSLYRANATLTQWDHTTSILISALTHLRYNASGDKVACAAHNGMAGILDIGTFKLFDIKSKHDEPCKAIEFIDDTTVCFEDPNTGIALYDLRAGYSQIYLASNNRNLVRALAMHAATHKLLASFNDGYIQQWDLRTYRQEKNQRVTSPALSIATHPQCTEFVTGHLDGDVCHASNLSKLSTIDPLQHKARVSSVALGFNGEHVYGATASYDGTVHMYSSNANTKFNQTDYTAAEASKDESDEQPGSGGAAAASSHVSAPQQAPAVAQGQKKKKKKKLQQAQQFKPITDVD